MRVSFGELEQRAHDEPVDGQQAECADDAASHGVVVADDGVLHRVREREQNHQVERVKLRQFALAKDAQQHHQRQVHDGGTRQLLQDRKRQLKHAVEDR